MKPLDPTAFFGETIAWEEVEPAAKKMFNVWIDGGEVEWAKECWAHFEAAGLTDASTVIEGTRSLLRLVALADIYREFCALAWEEDYGDAPISYLAEHFALPSIALGWLASEAGAEVPDDALEDCDLEEPALKAITSELRDEIHLCLCKAYGGPNQLYSRMSRTNHPMADEDDEDEFEVTPQNAMAFEFVSQGFRR